MIEEFVKLETAKLLKEKGFREDVFTFYEADSIEGDMKLSELTTNPRISMKRMIVFLHLPNLSPKSG